MSKFIELSDYDASIHREILDALTREDDAVVEICEDRAVAEMRCYLSRRYDCDKIFTATGDKRNQLVLMMAIDIAVYHIFCIHNPRNLSPLRKERHERAVEWLKAVATEHGIPFFDYYTRGLFLDHPEYFKEISVDGLPLLSEETRAAKSNFLIKSNRKRVNHW